MGGGCEGVMWSGFVGVYVSYVVDENRGPRLDGSQGWIASPFCFESVGNPSQSHVLLYALAPKGRFFAWPPLTSLFDYFPSTLDNTTNDLRLFSALKIEHHR